ncbi:MAG: cobyric acid synthase CobQ [Thermoprotei archaeon]|nr:MAG: cobyric acid synthase CobQ [Thermoprotei archaeon]
MGRALMVQGTSSGSGKSVLVAGLCRVFRRMGFKVAPFKAQNMSLNSYVSADGGEIARAQVFQALAAGVEPLTIMNPVLLKPRGDSLSQVIVLGKPVVDLDAKSYWSFALSRCWRAITRALRRLMEEFDVVVVEGAGSPAEINLYEYDVANMRVAEYAKSPVVLVADIERGGVFASIYGTVKLLKPRHRRLLRGFVVNKFRGDLDILRPGLERLERELGIPCLGVLPYVEGLKAPLEDSLSLSELTALRPGGVDVAVVRLPKISNFTDFEPLKLDESFSLRLVASKGDLGRPDVVVIPGSKNTISDLEWLNEVGLADAIVNLAGKTLVMGVCAGYQMLGSKVVDEGVETSTPKVVEGLNLLDVETRFTSYRKELLRVEAEVLGFSPLLKPVEGLRFKGYVIHMGRTTRRSCKPAFKLVKPRARLEGAIGLDGTVIGTCLHGLFDEPPMRIALAKLKGLEVSMSRDVWSVWNEELDRLASIVESRVDVDFMLNELRLKR